MSTEPPCGTLGQYVSELMLRLGESDLPVLARLREVVGSRRARITVDSEAVEVRWTPRGFEVAASGGGRVDGTGETDRQTVLALLAGEVEVYDAIVDGRLDVRGETGSIDRMFVAIEILLDAAARAPSLQALADDYRADPCLPRRRRAFERAPTAGVERDLLGRLGLLP